MEKRYDEIEELKEVLQNKQFEEDEELELREYLKILELKRDKKEVLQEKSFLTQDDMVRIKRRLDRKYKKKERRPDSQKTNIKIEEKRKANKTVRKNEVFKLKGASYKKVYDEPSFD